MHIEKMLHPSDFEEPELYESMKLICKKKSLKRKKKPKLRAGLKRPSLDLEKMMRVNTLRFIVYRSYSSSIYNLLLH